MKKYCKYWLFLFTFCLQIPAYAYNDEKINALTHTFMEKNQVPGLSMAVIDHNNIHFYNLGWADPVKKIPTSNQTIYTIGSFSKTFTATLAARAMVEKKLNLNDPFIHYFPELKNNSNLNKITFNELLAHASGLPFDFKPRPKNYPELIYDLQQFKLTRAPGSEYSYSNAGIGIVGYVLQGVYVMPYQDLLTIKIVKPLGMDSTYLNVPLEKQQHIAVGHTKDNQIVAYNKNLDIWFAAGSLKSSVPDLAKYVYAQIHIDKLKDKTLAQTFIEVHKNKYCFANPLSCEQLAWQEHAISDLKNSTGDTYFINFDKEGSPLFHNKKIINANPLTDSKIFIDKTGSGYGMSSYMAYIPEQKTGVVILTNKFLGDERIKLGRDILLSLSTS
ncbi:serine hydrolase [Rickettsiella endosymbiont of Miltochrista miniata]|uniref:serine hydrolase n=1 Tax=Rickettsiella endosymbiont of Miltochrista miniata TaxID=3066239 RepID=UPI00313A9709